MLKLVLFFVTSLSIIVSAEEVTYTPENAPNGYDYVVEEEKSCSSEPENLDEYICHWHEAFRGESKKLTVNHLLDNPMGMLAYIQYNLDRGYQEKWSPDRIVSELSFLLSPNDLAHQKQEVLALLDSRKPKDRALRAFVISYADKASTQQRLENLVVTILRVITGLSNKTSEMIKGKNSTPVAPAAIRM